MRSGVRAWDPNYGLSGSTEGIALYKAARIPELERSAPNEMYVAPFGERWATCSGTTMRRTRCVCDMGSALAQGAKQRGGEWAAVLLFRRRTASLVIVI
jgi:hypothetical protein